MFLLLLQLADHKVLAQASRVRVFSARSGFTPLIFYWSCSPLLSNYYRKFEFYNNPQTTDNIIVILNIFSMKKDKNI